MTRKAKHRLEGIVLKRSAYGEADWIVSFLTKEEGLLRAIAKHARASKKRFGGALDLFVSVRAEFSPAGERGGLWRVDAAELLEAHLGIRQSLAALELASQCCEAVLFLVHEHETLPALFEALDALLDAASAAPQRPALWRVWFLLQLLRAVGLAPHLDACIECGRTPEEFGEALFVSAEGGIVCQHCTSPQGPRRLPAAGVRVFSGVATAEASGLADLRVTEEGLALLDRLTLEFVEYRAGRRLESARTFRQPGS